MGISDKAIAQSYSRLVTDRCSKVRGGPTESRGMTGSAPSHVTATSHGASKNEQTEMSVFGMVVGRSSAIISCATGQQDGVSDDTRSEKAVDMAHPAWTTCVEGTASMPASPCTGAMAMSGHTGGTMRAAAKTIAWIFRVIQ